MLSPVLSIDHGVMHRTADLVSPDEDFDRIDEVRRISLAATW